MWRCLLAALRSITFPFRLRAAALCRPPPPPRGSSATALFERREEERVAAAQEALYRQWREGCDGVRVTEQQANTLSYAELRRQQVCPSVPAALPLREGPG